MLIRSYQSPASLQTDRVPLRLDPIPRRQVLLSLPNRGPVKAPSPRAPRILSNPFSYPDPLSDPQEDPFYQRVQEIRRLQSGTVAFETRRRRQNLPPDPGPQIRPVSATGQRRPVPQTRTGPRAKPARPNSAGHKSKPSTPASPLKRNTRTHH